jgi:hypothetical protein
MELPPVTVEPTRAGKKGEQTMPIPPVPPPLGWFMIYLAEATYIYKGATNPEDVFYVFNIPGFNELPQWPRTPCGDPLGFPLLGRPEFHFKYPGGKVIYQNQRWFNKPMIIPTYPVFGNLDPIVIDLYGNGIKTISVNQGVFFDDKSNGFAEQSGWMSPGAGLLCMDRNGNGTIDNGSELFGSHTPLPNGQLAANGYQALAALDSNQDGKIDAQDPAYSQLRVWVDSDTDGVSQPGELHTLSQLGIDSISLNWTTINTTDAQGSIEMTAGSFQKADGSIGQEPALRKSV